MLTLVFGIAVFLFWRYRYPFALTYQEQLQLFLFDGDYFWERMTEPGGFARYIAEFLVQFYNAMAIGAFILAVLFVLVQRLTWRLMKTHQSPLTSYLYPLSFIPALILWWYLVVPDTAALLAHRSDGAAGGRIDAAMDSSGWCSGLCVGADPAQCTLVAFPDVEGIAGY